MYIYISYPYIKQISLDFKCPDLKTMATRGLAELSLAQDSNRSAFEGAKVPNKR